MAKFDFQAPDYTEVKVTLGADVVKGEFVVLGTQTDGFYAVDGSNGDEATVITKCRKVKVEKNAGEAWASGNALYWDSTAENVTTTVSTNSLIGYAIAVAASADVVGYMDFDGTSRFKKA